MRFPADYHLLNWVPFVWVRETYAMGFAKMIQQLLMNIAMVVPMGLFAPIVFLRLRKLWKSTLSIVLFIFCVETVQYFIGRSADVDDRIMNTFGGVIGYGIFALMNRAFRQKNGA